MLSATTRREVVSDAAARNSPPYDRRDALGSAAFAQETNHAYRRRDPARGYRPHRHRIDYTVPEVAQRLARDGEGELIGLGP